MTFRSILWPHNAQTATADRATIQDLNLDQVFAATGGSAHEAVQYRPLRDVADVEFRQRVFRDLEDDAVRTVFEAFVDGMHSVRRHDDKARRLSQPHQRDRRQLDAETVYCRVVREMSAGLQGLSLRATGLREWREWLSEYVEDASFRAFAAAGAQVRADLDAVRYSVQVTGRHIVVDHAVDRPDYSEVIASAFARFRPESDPLRPAFVDPWPDMNEVEEQVIAAVIELYPGPFEQLEGHAGRYREFIDPGIARFDAEIRFYLDYLRFACGLGVRGMPFCYPEVTAEFSGIAVEGGFDAALGYELAKHQKLVVRNDFRLDDGERMLTVTGPNQGGKSTFARMFGQTAYLAALGCPVPGTRARIMLADNVLTHFVREDEIDDPHGALAQELTRMHDILQRLTNRSVLVLNESFSTTTASDAVAIGREVVGRIVERSAVAVYVTFLDELATIRPEVVSMVAVVSSGDDPARTFRIERRAPDGLAYAATVAQRHGLTYNEIRARVR
ncbi:DNA mismatch repair protein MutS [Nocardia sp. SYP-A9097]|uniref:MutS-related protein n=1 Tax=Nocardia sp. SYP-A9097 TaxID=2663237 RepID=UPI00129B78E9|nr:DNA mismatch repair protein MutS [Nocardia sp. SYP-A9097]MRH87672.1 DNA mismatch repair protein MutS [Nocardia sp. SYP-A9097]